MSWDLSRFAVAMLATLAATPGAAKHAADSTWSAQPPAPTAQADPADSVYRAARAALTRREYRQAATLFAAIETRFAGSQYAADARYWQAFALYRLGTDESLRQALGALRLQRQRHPAAATKGDAAALERRIQGELARRGDPDAAAAVSAAAQLVAAPPAPPSPPSPPAPPAPPTAYAAPRTGHAGGSSRTDCSEDDDDIKVAALNALQQMDPERAGPVLKKVLARRDAQSVCLRRKAIFLLAQQGAEGAEPTLLDVVRHDPDSEVREQAVFWLSQVGTDASVAALDSIVRTTTDPDLLDKAVFALSQQGSARAMQALRAYAERTDVPEGAREKAMFYLGQSGTTENLAFLRGLYGRLPERGAQEEGALFARPDRHQGECPLAGGYCAQSAGADGAQEAGSLLGRSRATSPPTSSRACTVAPPTGSCASSSFLCSPSGATSRQRTSCSRSRRATRPGASQEGALLVGARWTIRG